MATLRNARGENFPNLIEVAKVLKELKVNSVTVHLREDRRHINDKDIEDLSECNLLPINLEMAATEEMKQKCILQQTICLLYCTRKTRRANN